MSVTEGPGAGTPLVGIDGLHLHIESDQTPMHTLKIFVLDAMEGRPALQASDVVAAFRTMAQTFGVFRVIAVPAPLGIDQPSWFPVGDVDLEHHIKVRTVPAPGERREFDATVAAVTESRLPSDRPLWQAWILDGLVGGRIAVVLKLHHSMADGVAAANQLAMITDYQVWPEPPAPPTTAAPPRRTTLGQAVRGRARRLRELPALVGATRRASRDIRDLELPPLGAPGPPSRLRSALGPRRSFASTSLPLQDVRRARAAATDATVNDVVLALVGGAVRAVLKKRGELPARTLLTVVPVSTDPPTAAPRLWGNGFSQMLSTLGTDIDDPVTRLATVHEVTVGRKQAQLRLGTLTARWVDQIPPALLHGAVMIAERLGLAGRTPLPGVSVSNVHGPAELIELPQWGFAITELYSVGPVFNGMSLNVTAWSYNGRLQVVALTDTALIFDVHEVTEAMTTELDRLVDAVEQRRSNRAPAQS